jgi:hypothetical protein
VCTYTNVAVDNLCEGLAENSLSPLRVGYGGKVKASLYEHSLHHKLSLHPLKPKLEKLAEDEESLQKSLLTLGDTIRRLSEKGGMSDGLMEKKARIQRRIALSEKRLSITKAKMYALNQEMLHDIVGQADVVRFFSLLLSITFYSYFPSSDLHDMHHLSMCCIKRDRLSRCISRRSVDVNGACILDSHHERCMFLSLALTFSSHPLLSVPPRSSHW